MFREPHPFARFVNILGRGKSFSRALTIEEARESMGMILDGQALPEQIGAYLMLLRFKEEPRPDQRRLLLRELVSEAPADPDVLRALHDAQVQVVARVAGDPRFSAPAPGDFRRLASWRHYRHRR